jgi:hypothetical protein
MLVLAAAAAMLVACGHSSAPQSANSSSATGSDGLPGDHAHTARYTIDISYPPLSPEADVLTRAMHQRGEAAKRALMQVVQAAPAGRPVQLALVFEVASRTPRLLSVREKGLMDTGGAHPRPLIGTFVFDMQAKKLLSLDDLFNDPAKTRIQLAAFARRALYAKLLDKVPGGDKTPPKVRAEWQANMRGMIDPGTAPTPANFSHFLINSGSLDQSMSLTLVFPPYQVAPYVYGVQTVDVPLKVFAAGLRPAYRAAFGLAP